MKQMKTVWIVGIVFGLVFLSLLTIRMGVFDRQSSISSTDSENQAPLPQRDAWMNIFQNGQKIGYSHSMLKSVESGFLLQERVVMRINTMGVVQNIQLSTEGVLNPDYTLSSIHFRLNSGRFDFEARGKVDGTKLNLITKAMGTQRKITLNMPQPPMMVPAIFYAIGSRGLTPGATATFQIFDPATMGQAEVNVRVIGEETIRIKDEELDTVRVTLDFKGTTQSAWVSEDGQIVREEGILGIVMEKTTKEDAISRLSLKGSQDLTLVASIPSNVTFEDVPSLKRLKVQIQGISLENLTVTGGRQTLDGDVLTIEKESLNDLPYQLDPKTLPDDVMAFLKPSPLIQSDDERIRNLALSLIDPNDSVLDNARNLIVWIDTHIEKRPVLSVPDALSTLENRIGDCNEHAALLAAMARAVGIPAKVEAGLVYLDGRFYYHAWNLLYLGKWITADSLTAQIPADVTHIKLASGEQSQQLDLLGAIGRIQIQVIESAYD